MKTNDQTIETPARKHRKPNRLSGYDYSAPGYYFITICTQNHELLLGGIRFSRNDPASAEIVLSPAGERVRQAILAIPEHYPGTVLDKYVVMPNHIHLILAISEGRSDTASISRIVGQFKRTVSLSLGKSIWQQGFHDHVIRGDGDYREIWTYIDNNPLKWTLDRYYRE